MSSKLKGVRYAYMRGGAAYGKCSRVKARMVLFAGKGKGANQSVCDLQNQNCGEFCKLPTALQAIFKLAYTLAFKPNNDKFSE